MLAYDDPVHNEPLNPHLEEVFNIDNTTGFEHDREQATLDAQVTFRKTLRDAQSGRSGRDPGERPDYHPPHH